MSKRTIITISGFNDYGRFNRANAAKVLRAARKSGSRVMKLNKMSFHIA